MTVLAWLAPPVIGAAIGFITNDVAIRMLFRPLREYRILGIRVPFTPGIIPRRRRELAEAMGRMVSQELLTADALVAHLREARVQESVRLWVGRATSSVLEARLQDLAPSGDAGQAGGDVQLLAQEILEGFLGSDHLPVVVRSAVLSVYGSLGGASVDSLLGVADPTRAVARAVAGLVPGGGRLPWTEESLAAAAAMVRAAAGPMGKALERTLAGPQLRPELERRARELVRSALEKLNTVQRFLVRAGQYDRRLDEKMPEIVEDALRQIGGFLADEGSQEALAGAVRGVLAEQEDRDPTPAPETAGGHVVRESLVDLVASLLRPVLARPVGSLLEGLLGVSGEELATKLTDTLVAVARRPGAARSLMAAIRGAAGSVENRDVTLGGLLGISAEAKDRLDRRLGAKAIDLMAARLPEVLAGFDLRGMVVRRIDSLDVADVEKLLMMVIARHLKWINVFGALLGGLIGLSQVLLRLLG